jgi:hypothetical protein
MGIFAYWVVPNVIVYVGRVSIDTLIRYKWFFLSAAAVFLGLLIWVIYLRYLLARKSLESQTELEKHRLELAYQHGMVPHQQLTQSDDVQKVTWEGEIIPEATPPSKSAETTTDTALNS